MSEVLSIPIVGVPSLLSLSFNITNFDGIICSLIDAKNDNLYCGIFNNEHKPLQPYFFEHIDNIIQALSAYSENIIFVGDGGIIYREILVSNLGNITFFAEDHLNNFSSLSIGKAGLYEFENGNILNADTLSPLYLRKSQAERMQELNATNKN